MSAATARIGFEAEGPGLAAAPSPALERLRSLLPQPMRARIQSAREMERARRESEADSPLPTAVPALDRLLAGGLPRGQLTELVGMRSSGRFSAVLAILAAATGVGEAAALVDLGDGLDPAAASRMGADLERLLWVRPADMKQALAAAEMLLGAGFPLVVVDLGTPPVRGGRGLEAAWLRLARAAQAQESVLLVASPYRVSGTAAAVVLKSGRARAAWQGGAGSPWLLAGAAASLEVEKHRGKVTGHPETLSLSMADAPLPAAPAPKTRPQRISVAIDLSLEEPLRAAAGGR